MALLAVGVVLWNKEIPDKWAFIALGFVAAYNINSYFDRIEARQNHIINELKEIKHYVENHHDSEIINDTAARVYDLWREKE